MLENDLSKSCVTTEPNQAQLSRRDFLKLSGAGLMALYLADLSTKSEFEVLAESPPPPEEVAGGVDLTLSEAEIKEFERQWDEVKDKNEFSNFNDYSFKVAIMLNYTRAKGMRGEEFSQFVKDFINKNAKIDSKWLNIISEINDYVVPTLSAVRDAALDGQQSSAMYGVWGNILIQSLSLSYLFESDMPPSHPYNTGSDEFAYANLVPDEIITRGVDVTDPFQKQRLDYYVDTFDGDDEYLERIFDLRYSNPKKGIVQRGLTSINDLSYGDVLFRDKASGYKLGHLMTVVMADRDSNNNSTYLYIYDPNANGRMIAGVYNISSMDTIKTVWGENKGLGILHTETADDNLMINEIFYSGIKYESQIPVEVYAGRPDIVPDFLQIPAFTDIWKKFGSANTRPRAIQEVVSMIGMLLRDKKGNVVWGPTWADKWGNNYWLCSLYAQYLFRALGIKEMGHRFYKDSPESNQGDEYGALETWGYLNRRGREKGFVDLTHASTEIIDKMLKDGYVIYGATVGHNWIILPAETKSGKYVAVTSQAGYHHAFRVPNATYKYKRPRMALELLSVNEFNEGTLFAHILPNVKEPKKPYRQPLFSFNIQEINTPDSMNDAGIAVSIDAIKSFVGDKEPDSIWAELFSDHTEKIPSRGHYFNVVFDLVKTIQDYRLPIGRPASEDPAIFRQYLEKHLISKGYKNLIKSESFQTALNMVEAWFVTREMSKQTGRLAQPLQCQGFIEMCMAINNVKGAPPKVAGISGNAQDIAFKFLNLPITDRANQESFVDRYTKTLRFSEDLPTGLDRLREGDVFYLAYSSKGSLGHVGTVLTDPFIDAKGDLSVVVADSNRIYKKDMRGNYQYIADGMPRIRVMNYEKFKKEFLVDKEGVVNSRTVVIRRVK